MILTAQLPNRFEHAHTTEDVELFISRALNELAPGNPWVDMDCGEVASFHFAPHPITDDMFDEPPFDAGITATMMVMANRNTGYGALRWNHWNHLINPSLPADPRVVFDPYVPTWVRPEHVLTLDLVEQALREFIDNEGAQPTCVEWVRIDNPSHVGLMTDRYRALIRGCAQPRCP
ncbi:Imm1 family immunity protein [Saccharopolyspora phatthalungensis]|uniref:Uncharacterized protein n=1 Tax=Saccharopolyspora phatthalungensis TaxID=664693 RepID=A0A840Q2H5_9PSEU|nr:Imm1 family immunity protein [Saccharopolyspora phatthalungensis]MBB5154197.1 hypothetical protein [Saccharopolyspora phatthalungensis]